MKSKKFKTVLTERHTAIQQPETPTFQQPAIPILSTVSQFCEKYQAFTIGGIRFQIFNEESNGLKKSGAIIRIGRKVLINDSKYFAWLETQNAKGGV